MGKKPFTTRLDEAVLELAQRVAEAERRSVTSIFEVALIEYAKARGQLLGMPREAAITTIKADKVR